MIKDIEDVQKSCCLCENKGLMGISVYNGKNIHFPYIGKNKTAHLECYIKKVIAVEVKKNLKGCCK